jgi:hypothetical protein
MIERYMSKPAYVDVLKYVDDERDSVFAFANGKAEFIIPVNTKQLTLYVHTDMGPKKCNPNDYIVKDTEGTLSVLTEEQLEGLFLKVKKTESKLI